jgi:hypothetical protein
LTTRQTFGAIDGEQLAPMSGKGTATGTAKPVGVDCRLRWLITARGSLSGHR